MTNILHTARTELLICAFCDERNAIVNSSHIQIVFLLLSLSIIREVALVNSPPD